MRTARLIPALTVAALALPVLAGCGNSSSSASAGSTGSSAGSGSSPGSGSSADPSSARTASCAVAPADLVGSALGDTLSAATETRNGDTIVVCDYKGAKAGLVKLRIQTDSSAAGFDIDRKSFAAQKMQTTDQSFEDEAFSNVLGSGNNQVTTLVARRGPVEILIAANATLVQESNLLSQLFARV